MNRSSPPGPRMLGRYVLHDEIASGGMAAVHYGQLSGPVGFSRGVAIKRLHAQFARDPEFVTMFLDEARLAARIRHPNVVQTLDVVTLEGEVFIVLEYIAGESLSRLSRAARQRKQPIPTHIAVAIVTGVLHGLHGAHEATDEQGNALELVHRDVSPQNVMVGIDGIARVLDFGVAKAAGRLATTRDGHLKGKVAYMAPEQLANTNISRRSDTYASCVVLWELFAGKRLFDSESEAGMLTMVLNPVIAPPSSLNPNISPALDAIVMKGLALKPEDRYATAREMAMALEQHGGLTSPSEVAAWVQNLAGEALRKRAMRVAEIESQSSKDVSVRARALVSRIESGPSLEEMATMASPPTAQRPSLHELGSMPGSTAEVQTRRRGKGLAAVVVALGAIGVLSAGVGIGRCNSGSKHATGSDMRDLDASVVPPNANPSASTTQSSAPDAALLLALDDAADAAVAATPSASASATTPVPHPHPHTVPPHLAKDDCDPPYTWDSSGHKIYKRNCLNGK